MLDLSRPGRTSHHRSGDPMSTHTPRSLSGSKAAAAVLNALISVVGLIVSIAPLHLGAEGAGADGDNPPFAVSVVGVALEKIGPVGSLGIWRGERWGLIVSVVGAALVIFLLLRPSRESVATTRA